MTKTPPNVIGKLKAYRDSHNGENAFTMPRTKVQVTFPDFINHGDLNRCMRMAKGDAVKAQTMFICKYAKFDGETITLADFNAFIPMSDVVVLHNEIFDDDEDEEPGEQVEA